MPTTLPRPPDNPDVPPPSLSPDFRAAVDVAAARLGLPYDPWPAS